MPSESIDLLVVGSGPAGLAAATEAARSGANTVVLDEAPAPGGRLGGQVHYIPGLTRRGAGGWIVGAERSQRLCDEALNAGVTICCGRSVWGLFPGWYAAHLPTVPDTHARPEPAGYHTRGIILAAGAMQNAMLFPGWTLPGVITAGAAQSLLNVNGILPGRRPVMVGIDPVNLAVAQVLAAAGVKPIGMLAPPDNGLNLGPVNPGQVVKQLSGYAAGVPDRVFSLIGKIGSKTSALAACLFPRRGIQFTGVPVMARRALVSAEGEDRVEAVTAVDLTPTGIPVPATCRQWSVDTVITAAGLSPLVELAQVAGCPLVNLPQLGGWVPVHGRLLQTPVPGLFVAGSITGIEGAEVAEAQGRLAGFSAACHLGLRKSDDTQKSFSQRLADIHKARGKSVRLLPEIDRGRQWMQKIWKNRRSGNPQEPSMFSSHI